MCTRRANEVNRVFHTPWGEGTLTVLHGRLVEVDLPVTAGSAGPVEESGSTGAMGRGPSGPRAVAGHDGLVTDPADQEVAARWVAELEAYFAGARLSWTADEVGLDELAVGDFAKAVYAALLTVPPAVTVSYGTLAAMAGFPRAARAVGTAMATNPIPIVIPCHRVIRADGSLGNYGDDPALKAQLLAHESKHVRASGGKR